MPQNFQTPKIINSLSEVLENFDLFMFDLWGVTHNGKIPFSGAIDCLQKIQKYPKKKAVFLSNAPRLLNGVLERLSQIGIDKNLYNGLYTSGMDCHQALKNKMVGQIGMHIHPPQPTFPAHAKKFFHIGSLTDTGVVDNIPYQKATSVENSDFLIVTGAQGWETDSLAYHPILKQGIAKNLPLLCANSDLEVMYGNQMVICAGKIAKDYYEMGGAVFMYGKPNKIFYENAISYFTKQLNITPPLQRILMIGDSLYTDIKGANNIQIPSLLVGTGVLQNQINESHEFSQIMQKLCNQYDAQPNFFIHKLKI